GEWEWSLHGFSFRHRYERGQDHNRCVRPERRLTEIRDDQLGSKSTAGPAYERIRRRDGDPGRGVYSRSRGSTGLGLGNLWFRSGDGVGATALLATKKHKKHKGYFLKHLCFLV